MNYSLILIPFFSVVILNLPLGKFAKNRASLAFWFCLLVLVNQICFTVSPAVFSWSGVFKIFSQSLKFDLHIDNFSRIMLFCIGIVTLCALFVQKYTSGNKEGFFNFINVLLLILVGMNGTVMVRDIFSLYVFLEITAVSSFILIGFNKDALAFEAAFKYIILSVFATALMLSSIALLLYAAKDTGFLALSRAISTSPNALIINIAIGIFICACFIKAGLMPFHGWVADAYSQSPASASVLLAGVVTKTVGVYTLIRIVTSVFGLSNSLKGVLLVVGVISIVLAALAALGQNDFKRLLAYSSISQVGYIILGLGCGTALGLAGAIFHLFNHAIFKSLLFVNSASVEQQSGTRNLDNLSGLGKVMPITGTTSILASLSASGIPPLAGFWSKLIIVVALWVSGLHAYAVVAVLASVLTLAYFLKLQRRVFFGKMGEGLEGIKEAGFYLAFPAIVLALITIGVGVFFPFFAKIFIAPGAIIGG